MSTAVHSLSPALDDAFAPKNPPIVFIAPTVKTTRPSSADAPESSRKTRPAKSSAPRPSSKPTRQTPVKPEPEQPLHFIASTLRRQGASLGACARRLGLTPAEAEAQTRPDADLPLSQLYAWRDVLDVPLSELLPLDEVVPDPIRNRALLLRTMKTARQLQELSRGSRLERVAVSLIDQLVELMPELANVPAWPSVGQSRAPREAGSVTRRVDAAFSRFIEERS